MINKLLAKSLKKFFGRHLLIFGDFGGLPLKNQVSRFTLNSKCILTKSTIFCDKNLKIIVNIFYISVKKKNETLGQKKGFFVCLEEPLGDL